MSPNSIYHFSYTIGNIKIIDKAGQKIHLERFQTFSATCLSTYDFCLILYIRLVSPGETPS